MVNVNRKNTDQFYRYKMPKLLAKVGRIRLIWQRYTGRCWHTYWSGSPSLIDQKKILIRLKVKGMVSRLLLLIWWILASLWRDPLPVSWYKSSSLHVTITYQSYHLHKVDEDNFFHPKSEVHVARCWMVYCFSDPTKFFGCELGAQTQIDLKNERYIVNGSHDGEKLQEILDDFIQKFVLCPECENPETVLVRFDKLRIFTRVLTLSPHRNIITNIKHLSNT